MMRCRHFHRLLADWTRDRLEVEAAERMSRHALECRSCAEEAELERTLRTRFQELAPVSRTPDLWERIEARVQTTRRPRFAFIFRFQRAIALSGAMAAGFVLAVIATRGPDVVAPSPHLGTAPNAVIALSTVDKINELKVPEPAGAYGETPFSGEAAQMLLVSRP